MKKTFLKTIFFILTLISITGFLFPPKVSNHILKTQSNFDGSKTYIYEDGRMYEGEIDTKLNRSGIGSLYLEDRVVVGKFDKNIISKGTIIYSNGDVYEGDIVEYMAHGSGEILYSDGSKYIGKVKFDKADGKGFLMHSDGKSYNGEFKYGTMHGKGRLTVDGALTQGEFKYNKYIKYLPSSEF